MSIAGQIINRFGSKHRVTRQRKEGSYIEGKWVPTGRVETFQIIASIQPIDGDMLEMLPEGERSKEMRTLYTTTKLQTVNENKTINADIVSIDDGDWEVQKVEKWNPNMLDHFKCLVVRMNRQE